jgi:hypothetical protein
MMMIEPAPAHSMRHVLPKNTVTRVDLRGVHAGATGINKVHVGCTAECWVFLSPFFVAETKKRLTMAVAVIMTVTVTVTVVKPSPSGAA